VTAISIALVDDHRVVSRCLKAYLESFPDVTVVGIAASGEALLEHPDEWQPQVVIQDLLLAGGIDGIQTTRRIIERAPSVRVIALTASIDDACMMVCCVPAPSATSARTPSPRRCWPPFAR
jgi:DNA-binding NarL/FixJ family response regulator